MFLTIGQRVQAGFYRCRFLRQFGQGESEQMTNFDQPVDRKAPGGKHPFDARFRYAQRSGEIPVSHSLSFEAALQCGYKLVDFSHGARYRFSIPMIVLHATLFVEVPFFILLLHSEAVTTTGASLMNFSQHRFPIIARRAFFGALLIYVVAKLAELGDYEIAAVVGPLTGHTLKHLLATVAAAVLVDCLVRRVGAFTPLHFSISRTGEKSC